MNPSARERARLERRLRAWIGRQMGELRADAGITTAGLARCAGLDPSHVWRIEAGQTSASLAALVAIATCLGAEVGVRMFPIPAPRLRDQFQAPMVEGLIRELGPDWAARPELPVPAARGVIDLVLRRQLDHLIVMCECHSELRRLELVLRRMAEKAEALKAQTEAGPSVSNVLLLRSTSATRSVARAYAATLGAAFPARAADALGALRGRAAWPGATVIWAEVHSGRASILEDPPRGIRLGR